MKPKNFIFFALIVAVVGVGFWWYIFQPEPVAPVKTAAVAAPTPSKVSAPTPAPATGITAPMANPVQLPQTVMTTPAQNDTQAAQAELNVIIDDMAAMMRSGDMIGIALKYTPPDGRPSGIPPGKEAQAQAMQQVTQQMQADPRMQPIFEAQAQAMESIKDQQPVLNAAGDEATYQVSMPALTLPNGMSVPARTEPAIFIKIDGQWYIKDRGK